MQNSKDSKFDIVILGGGIIGLFQAIEAKRRGLGVALVEKNILGYGASGAGSGILMTHGATQFHSLFREFYVRSINEYYPEWLERLSCDNSETITTQRTGSWQLYTNHQKLESLAGQLQREASQNFESINRIPDHLKSWMKEDGFVGGFYFADEEIIHNGDLLNAMRKWATSHQVEIFENANLLSCEFHEESWNIQLPEGSLNSTHLIAASGAWVDDALRPLGYESKMTPVRGQLAWYPSSGIASNLTTSIHIDGHFYAIPRRDGFLLGATTEARQWDQNFNQIGEDFLTQNIHKYFPSERQNLKYAKAWAGLRPRTRDRKPLMGCVDFSRNLWISAGHYKNGLSMAPLAARVMIQAILGETPDIDFEEFSPLRKKGLSHL